MKKTVELAKLVRYYILESTTTAGSGHPTSSLSAADLMTVLLFGGHFRFRLDQPKFENNDRLLFSKGHAAPLLYALFATAGKYRLSDLKKLRQWGSQFEGHPTLAFPYTEAATGSLGQGLSVGVGMALNAKRLSNLSYRTFVLLGDSEMAEGSVWEAIELASYYRLDNLIGILDVNRLGQRGQTMDGYNLKAYQKRLAAFGWRTILVDGHDHVAINKAFRRAIAGHNRPVMIIAKTVKGKGFSLWENKNGWHGRTLPPRRLPAALAELGKINTHLTGKIKSPFALPRRQQKKIKYSKAVNYRLGDLVSTRQAYGQALLNIFSRHPELVVLDAETSNSTYAATFGKKYPQRFLEMFIAEQNMVGVALGLARRGQLPFVSTFAAFFSRAFDQIRMTQYSEGNIKFVGSHAGVSIGPDGASQMGLEDIAMFRSVSGCVVLYPSDAQSCLALVAAAAARQGMVYLRMTRKALPVIYSPGEKFVVGGSKLLKSSRTDQVTVVAAGITVFEALKAYEVLSVSGIKIRVIDLYSIKPLDRRALLVASRVTGKVVTVEDHHLEGGLGEAVSQVLAGEKVKLVNLAVRRLPSSGTPEQLLKYEQIDAAAIIKTVKKLIR